VSPFYLNDYLTAYLGAAGALTALYRRCIEGGSYHVKVSLARSSMWVQGIGLLAIDPMDSALRLHDPDSAKMFRFEEGPFGEVECLAPVTRYSEAHLRNFVQYNENRSRGSVMGQICKEVAPVVSTANGDAQGA
jgi:crotonobetainyl-CoA:carnitine CoA-transferase CaiB-like acyl-CoA transferase